MLLNIWGVNLSFYHDINTSAVKVIMFLTVQAELCYLLMKPGTCFSLFLVNYKM